MSEPNAFALKWQGVACGGANEQVMSLRDATDEELMLQCRSGNLRALEELFRRYKDRIYSFAYRMLGRRASAEDVLQETFLRVQSNADSWHPTARFSCWVYRIARNLCVDEMRKYWNRHVYADSQVALDENGQGLLSIIPSEDADPRTVVEERRLQQRIDEAIAALSPEQQEVIILSKYQGLSYPEIAEVLNISQESVKQRAYRAHMRLRAVLRPLLEEQSIR